MDSITYTVTDSDRLAFARIIGDARNIDGEIVIRDNLLEIHFFDAHTGEVLAEILGNAHQPGHLQWDYLNYHRLLRTRRHDENGVHDTLAGALAEIYDLTQYDRAGISAGPNA